MTERKIMKILELIRQLKKYTIKIPTYSESKNKFKKGTDNLLYPILLRVFINNNKVIAVSNVHQQLNIPDTVYIRRLAQDCIDRSNEIVAMAKCNDIVLDTSFLFSIRENNSVVFEEEIKSEDKACFTHPITKRTKKVSGFILKYGQNPLPLNELRYIPIEGYYNE